MIEPYQRFAPGFVGTFRPDFLAWRRFSLGAGLGLHISSRYQYETTTPQPITGISGKEGWYYFNENFIESSIFDFFAEAAWRFLGKDEDARWSGWLTLNSGLTVSAASRSAYQTQYEESGDSLVSYAQYSLTYKTIYRTDAYLSPGVTIGINRFIVGYQHWFYFDENTIPRGKPARLSGTLRIGYRFTW
jgi:hypothetical protein